ncbi:MAG TPA: histidine ammonia-lyase [Acidimicrobiales bacterium]|nr:histidine ammonia-lyase [Acidimicrobiales bacterium]
MTVVVSGTPLTIDEVVRVARAREAVDLDPGARDAMARARAVVEELGRSAEPVYGVSTGFGAMATRHIAPADRRRLQVGVVRSHAAGMGPPVEDEVVRAMTLLPARTLASGVTGARPLLAERLIDLLNTGTTPTVPEYGSLGCSGDLAPLAHVALALVDGGLVLEEKEGLSLINGTDGMLGMLCLAVTDAATLLATADVTAAMSVEALLGTDQAFAADVVALRPHPGQQKSAANLRALLAGSPIVASHRHGDRRVQDAYSLRCAPQVHGAARDVLDHVRAVVDRELAAAIDNPVVIDGRVASHGNFHGAPLAYAADMAAIVLTDVVAMSERRVDRHLDANRSNGLPPFLADDPGVDSGLMIAQYTAAALVAEARRLSVPASVDSIPTSALQEDHVSMGWAAARKLRRVLSAVGRVLAVEAVVAARSLDLRRPLTPAAGTGAALDRLRDVVPGPGPDRVLAPELAAATELVTSGALLQAARAAVEVLG